MPGIYTIQSDGKLLEMKEEPYSAELLLQRLLADYPNLLAGDQIDPLSPRRWLLVRREAAVPSEEDGPGRWALDHLFLDQDGVPTLVEVKRSSNSDIRRKVVGQMLEYAAHAQRYWPIESIQEWFEKACELQGRDEDDVLHEFIAKEIDTAAFWKSVKTNLQAGRIRLLFVADEVPPELQRIVEFLNEQMDPTEVFAVEIRQFVGPASKTLVPRLIGRTGVKIPESSEQPARWDTKRFLDTFQEVRTPAETQVARKLLDWASVAPKWVWWGKGKLTGTFVAEIDFNNRHYQLFNVSTDGKVSLPFDAYSRRPPFEPEDKRRELLARFNSFLDAKIPETAIDKYPTFPLAELTDSAKLSKFLSAFDVFIEQVRAT
jgi:hypothetical protein